MPSKPVIAALAIAAISGVLAMVAGGSFFAFVSGYCTGFGGVMLIVERLELK